MKRTRLTATLLTIAILFGLLAILPGNTLASDPVKVIVNGKNVAFPDVQPYIDKNGRTIVPVRFVTEALGCDVEWNGTTQTVTIDRGQIHVELTIGKNEIKVWGVKKTMDTTAVLQGGRTLVPIRFVAEAFGCEVDWDSKTRTAIITDPGKDIYKVGAITLYIEEGDDPGSNTDGGLTVFKKSGLILGAADTIYGNVLTIQIKVDIPSSDIPKRRQETEELLKQCFSEKLVEEFMAYIATKKTLDDRLALKEWNEGKYSVDAGGSLGPIVIMVRTG